MPFSKSNKDKEILCTVPELRTGDGTYTIYVDGTWRYSSWSPDDFSRYKIVKHKTFGIYIFSYKHGGCVTYYSDTDVHNKISDQDRLLIDTIQMERSFRKMLRR